MSAHMRVWRSRFPLLANDPDHERWVSGCVLEGCPGNGMGDVKFHPTQSAAMHAALDHVALYAHENAGDES